MGVTHAINSIYKLISFFKNLYLLFVNEIKLFSNFCSISSIYVEKVAIGSYYGIIKEARAKISMRNRP